jgi:outer membrane protein assembly factor BamA
VGAGGNVQLFNGSKTYPDRLFFLGGVDTLRAFYDSTVVPQDVADLITKGAWNPATQQPWTINDVLLRGGDFAINPRVELRVPLFNPFQAGLFLDMGNLWLDPTKIHLDRDFLRLGLGPGLRVETPIGPLALDYGFNLNRRDWEDLGAFHFSIGLF